MKLRARWIGPPPRSGDYLMSEVRPRFAYRIVQVHGDASEPVRWDAVQKVEVRQIRIDVARTTMADVPRAARIHAWKWDKREAKLRRGGRT